MNDSKTAHGLLVIQDRLSLMGCHMEIISEPGKGTQIVIEVPRVVFASSNHVAGAYLGFEPDINTFTQPELPKISPLDPIRPDSDYGVSKVFGEAVARYYSDRWGIKAICLRIGAVLEDDDPTAQSQNQKIWLSHRDLLQLVEKSLSTNVTFGIYYGVPTTRVPSGTFPMSGQI